MKLCFIMGDDERTVVDFDEVALGPESACRRIKVDGEGYLEVSRPIDFKIPEDVRRIIGTFCKSCVVSDKQPLRPDGTRICYWAIYDGSVPYMVTNMGTTFEGDSDEFGRYILWNPETGELSLSEELGWGKVAGFDD
ncbi:MAG: hypothetical protein ACI4TC_06120 [Kiritimatiellia bacterium]